MRIIEQRNRFHAKAHWPLTLACCMILYSDTPSRAQTPYLLQRGAPTFTSADPFELGYVNLANGVVHVEIPLAASPQRGDRGFTFKLVYDSNIWHIVNTGSALVWQPDNAYYYGSWPGGGWRIIASSDLQPTYSTQATNCGGSNCTGFIQISIGRSQTGLSITSLARRCRTAAAAKQTPVLSIVTLKTLPDTTFSSPATTLQRYMRGMGQLWRTRRKALTWKRMLTETTSPKDATATTTPSG